VTVKPLVLNSNFKSSVFDVYIGIDQTGAVTSKGVPRDLPATILHVNNFSISIFANLKLPSMTTEEIQKLIKSVYGPSQKSRAPYLVCVDAALGLPEFTGTSFSDLKLKVAHFEKGGKKYGARLAHDFFRSFLGEMSRDIRTIEKITGSNSVFNLHPYQKNIGCGTFRILKDLTRSDGKYSVWPFEDFNSAGCAIAEGYPSLYWKALFGLKKRSLEDLKKLVPQLQFTSVDSADSFVLALAGLLYHKQILKIPSQHICRREGWILGVPYEAVETMFFDPWKSTLRAQDLFQT
jgi:hypothetical protein